MQRPSAVLRALLTSRLAARLHALWLWWTFGTLGSSARSRAGVGPDTRRSHSGCPECGTDAGALPIGSRVAQFRRGSVSVEGSRLNREALSGDKSGQTHWASA